MQSVVWEEIRKHVPWANSIAATARRHREDVGGLQVWKEQFDETLMTARIKYGRQ